MEKKLSVAMFGQKRLSREGGVEIVVKELCTRMVKAGHKVTCYNRSGHHVSGAEYDRKTEYTGIRQRPGTDSGHPCKHCRHKWECGYLLHQCRKKFRSVLGDTEPPMAGAVRP